MGGLHHRVLGSSRLINPADNPLKDRGILSKGWGPPHCSGLRSSGRSMPFADFGRRIPPPRGAGHLSARSDLPGSCLPPSRSGTSDHRHRTPSAYRASRHGPAYPAMPSRNRLPFVVPALCQPASSGFPAARDTRAFGPHIPVGREGDFHPSVNAPCRVHQITRQPAIEGAGFITSEPRELHD